MNHKATAMTEQSSLEPSKICLIGVGGVGCRLAGYISKLQLPAVNIAYVDSSFDLPDRFLKPRAFLVDNKNLNRLQDFGNSLSYADDDWFPRCQIEQFIASASLTLIVTGIRGATGSKLAPLLASISKNSGIPTLGLAITPFDFEMQNSYDLSQLTRLRLSDFRRQTHAVASFSNEALMRLLPRDITMEEAFSRVEVWLSKIVRHSIWITTSFKLTDDSKHELPFRIQEFASNLFNQDFPGFVTRF